MKRDKAIERGRKLLEMAKRGGTGPEREMARQRLDEHLGREGLSELDLRPAQEPAEAPAPSASPEPTMTPAPATDDIDLVEIFEPDDEIDGGVYRLLVLFAFAALVVLYLTNSDQNLTGTIVKVQGSPTGAQWVTVRLEDGSKVVKRYELGPRWREGWRVEVAETTIGLFGNKRYTIQAPPEQALESAVDSGERKITTD